MSTILNTIADYAKIRVENDKKHISLCELKALCADAEKGGGVSFYDALKRGGMSFICEVKKASPSKGIIAEDFDYLGIAQEYERAGADCMSVLTEPKWFLGSDEIFTEIRKTVETPMIRKDFVVDEYQIYQARLMGANAVLLICALHDTEFIAKGLQICDDLGIEALVETHDESEIDQAISAGAKIFGVNNRNLKDFSVDFSNAARLRDKIPADAVYVAESGVKTADDVAKIASIGADAALIGEAFMRSDDKTQMLKDFRAAAKR